MGPIQQKITAAILHLIRERRKSLAASEPEESAAVAPARLREAEFSDFSAVAELKQRWELDADSFENWERLWRRNPVLAQLESHRPIGWVLEAEGRVVGYLGNISSQYRYGTRTLTAVSSHGLVAEPPYRIASVSLVAAFYRQKNVDLYLTTTAIPEVGKIAKAFKFDALPQADYETVLFWVLQPSSFGEEMMEKLGLKRSLARVGGAATSLAVGIDRFFRRRRPSHHSTGLTVSKIAVSEIGDDFQSLWLERVNGRPRLFANRSSAVLRWHYDIPGDRGSARVLCCRKNGELLGYAVIRHDPQPNGLRKSLLADILAKQDDPEVLRAVLIAAYEDARSAGSYILEVLGLPANIRSLILQWNPYIRKYPACPFYYKAADPALHKELSDAKAWYATPFDGDTTLIRPSFSSFDPPNGSAVQIKTTLSGIGSDASERLRSEVF